MEYGLYGRWVGVAVIDSGINSQIADLGDVNGNTQGAHSRVVYEEDFTVAPGANGQYGPNRYTTQDQYGHGTHVAGIIAGKSASFIRYPSATTNLLHAGQIQAGQAIVRRDSI